MYKVMGGVRGVSHCQGDGRGERIVSHVQGDGRGEGGQPCSRRWNGGGGLVSGVSYVQGGGRG